MTEPSELLVADSGFLSEIFLNGHLLKDVVLLIGHIENFKNKVQNAYNNGRRGDHI